MTTVVQERKAIVDKYLLIRRMIIKTPCIIALMVSENGRANYYLRSLAMNRDRDPRTVG